MKFGKSIRAEARNNRGLAFVNFKYLKRILKRWVAAANAGTWALAKEEDKQFHAVLELELERVGESFGKELKQILLLQALIQQTLPSLDVQPNPDIYSGMGFEGLQAHLQSLGGLNDVSVTIGTPEKIASTVKTSAALCDFCVNLGKISARCKRLRRCVLWNAVAIVKILKKRQKNVASEVAEKAVSMPLESAAQMLSRQDWYRSPELAQVVSILDTTTDTLMQRLTGQPPSREQYQCPICLDVVLDPVSLRTCGHRFCWACLCMAYCEKPEGALERCPCCRAAFPLDPEAFVVDGILSRFLKTFFPEVQSSRLREQRESLRHRLTQLQQRQLRETDEKQKSLEDQEKGAVGDIPLESRGAVSFYGDHASLQSTDKLSPLSPSSTRSTETSLLRDGITQSPEVLMESSHCCPDCSLATVGKEAEEENVWGAARGCVSSSWLLNSAALNKTATQYLTDVEGSDCHNKVLLNGVTYSAPQPHTDTQRLMCRHQWNVKQGKPADVERFAFTSVMSSASFREQSGNKAAGVLSSAGEALTHSFQSPTAQTVSDCSQQPWLESFVDQVVSSLLSETGDGSRDPHQHSREHGLLLPDTDLNLVPDSEQSSMMKMCQRDFEERRQDRCGADVDKASSSLLPPVPGLASLRLASLLNLSSNSASKQCVLLNDSSTDKTAASPELWYGERTAPSVEYNVSGHIVSSIPGDDSGISMPWTLAYPLEEAVDEEDDEIEEQFLKLQCRRQRFNIREHGLCAAGDAE